MNILGDLITMIGEHAKELIVFVFGMFVALFVQWFRKKDRIETLFLGVLASLMASFLWAKYENFPHNTTSPISLDEKGQIAHDAPPTCDVDNPPITCLWREQK